MGLKRFNDLTNAELPGDQPYFRITTQRINPGDSPEEPVVMEVDEATYTAMFNAASQAINPAPPPAPAASGAPAALHALLARANWGGPHAQSEEGPPP
jgi:hypothetical protein